MSQAKTSHFNVYCDESRHTSNPEDPFMVIGALACPRDKKDEITRRINAIRKQHDTWREFGWKTLSPNRRDFYWSLLNLFATESCLSFRCIVADRSALDHDQFNDGDNELGFYKLYYQMLVHWLKRDHAYHIFLDGQQNRTQRRFIDLRDILRRRLTGKAKVECLEPVSSHSIPLIQLVDLLIGAVGYAWNERQGSEIKLSFCADVAKAAGLRTLKTTTTLSAEKFNIFHFTGR
ncbi:MAG: DUF3800 domain-containing protein [Trichlorobacter sp.]|uniref:DUF3800 domain-containing protein n=1 Tax=Trichlorobacter sp. TaxID=2911007 RepID=UPI002565E554|nr:DUF3800 domain-containing protein [Trichlorobacter sp.]